MADLAAQVDKILKLTLAQGKQIDELVAKQAEQGEVLAEILDAVTNEEAANIEIVPGTPTEQP